MVQVPLHQTQVPYLFDVLLEVLPKAIVVMVQMIQVQTPLDLIQSLYQEEQLDQQLAFRYLDPYQPDNQRTVMDHLSQEAQAVAAEEVPPGVGG